MSVRIEPDDVRAMSETTRTPTDDRLVDVPMRPVSCLRCAARVEVRKSSRQQTSIQWHQAAMASCEERSEHSSNALWGCRIDICAALRDSIARAVQQGNVHVLDDKD